MTGRRHSAIPFGMSVVTATVLFACLAIRLPAAVLYEPFDYPVGAIAGRSGGDGWGSGNAWRTLPTGESNLQAVASPGLAFGDLVESGNSIVRTANNRRSSMSRGFSAAGLTGDNSTVWFSLLFADNNNGRGATESGFALATADFDGQQNDPRLPGAVGNDGIGFTTAGGNLKASGWVGGGTATDSAGTLSVGANDSTRFLVGKIDWGTADTGDSSNHSVTVFNVPSNALSTEPSSGGVTLSGLNFDQSAIDIVTWQDNKTMGVDEIRVGTTYADVAPISEPSPSAGTYLITATDSNYTSDGTNTWNPLGGGFLKTVTPSGSEVALKDNTGDDSGGLQFSVTEGAGGSALISSNGGTTWPSLPWFSDVDGQTDHLNVDDGQDGTWKISGFHSADRISVQWIANHHNADATRATDVKINGAFSSVISGKAVSSDDFLTHSGKDEYMEWSGISPNANGQLVIDWASVGNRHSAVLTAMRLEVITIPEPSALLIWSLLAALGIGAACGRRK
jgi:hypothetical protein